MPPLAEAAANRARQVREWWAAALLGWAAIGAYGVGLYAFGVLIEPIHRDTLWSRGALSAAFSIGAFGAAAGSAVAGRTLDRYGGAPVLGSAVVVGTGLLFVAASADSLPVFDLAWGLGTAAVGAGGFYHVTMALSARRHPGNTALAFAILTFVGGLASPLYFPLTAAAIDAWGWRAAVRLLALSLPLTVLPAGLFVKMPRVTPPDPGNAAAAGEPAGPPLSIAQAYRTQRVLQTVLMITLSRMAAAALQVHQVPAMAAAGMSITSAANAAAFRGVLSLPGRAVLEPLVRRLGVVRALVAVHVIVIVGVGALVFAGPYAFIAAYILLTGLAFGTMLPLAGLFSLDVYGRARLGSMLGLEQAIVGVGAATGPILIGASVDITGSYALGLTATGALWVAAIGLMLTVPPGERPASAG